MKSPFVVIGVFALGVIVLLLWTWPAYQSYAVSQGELQGARVETQNRETYFTTLASLEKELQQYPTELAHLNAAFPANPDLPSLYDNLQDIAASSGLIMTAVSANVAKEATPKEAEVNVTLEGSYAGLKEFLRGVQQSSRAMQVTSLEFATPKEGARFEFRIHVKAFSL